MFAEVLINHAFARKQAKFTYEIPKDFKVELGSGVVIPFNNKNKAGLVIGFRKEQPEFQTKAISELIQEEALLWPWQIQLANWISDYYFCSSFDAFKLMLPKHIWRVPKKERKRPTEVKSKAIKTEHKLTKPQQEILNSILNENPKTSLIHGITGAGKTEVYKHLIKAKAQNGQQALLLVPEISLTPQLVKYFEGSFPEIAVIHSRISEGNRAKHWKNIHQGKTQLVIGSRSAIFSPFKNLGLIIMDEEHEWTYKQDQSPRYNTKDVALKISELTGCQVLFGSATPNIETMWKAQEGDIKLYTLPERISGTPLPKVQIVDMREELKAKNFSIFSNTLEQKIKSTLENKDQVILFLNRRGSASATVCRDCGLAAECPHCETKLTYHARKFAHETLICHHCGRINQVPQLCPKCASPRIRHLGVGTQRVETELQKLFPSARICRADRDTMNKRDSFKDLHKQLINKEIDILIGTQMIGKGFDIPNVSLVGIILADLGLHIPDFRAAERSFQLLTQVAGRAGRREKQGEVIIQTYNPDHPAIVKTIKHDYNSFYEQEINSRKIGAFPPFSSMIKLIFVNENKELCKQAAKELQELIGDEEHQVFAAPALISKINKKYYWHLLIIGPNPRNIIQKLPPEKLEGWRIDVDPINTV